MGIARRSEIHGHVSKGFEAVRNAFVENFSHRRELVCTENPIGFIE